MQSTFGVKFLYCKNLEFRIHKIMMNFKSRLIKCKAGGVVGAIPQKVEDVFICKVQK